MTKARLNKETLLQYIPQQPPFRFVDEITSVDEKNIEGTYFFKKDEFFYRGHFPNDPVTPGVILIESMCQVGLVALGYYLLSIDHELDELTHWHCLFADTKTEFFKVVYPETKVFIHGAKLFWRLKKIQADVKMFNSEGQLIAKTVSSGVTFYK